MKAQYTQELRDCQGGWIKVWIEVFAQADYLGGGERTRHKFTTRGDWTGESMCNDITCWPVCCGGQEEKACGRRVTYRPKHVERVDDVNNVASAFLLVSSRGEQVRVAWLWRLSLHEAQSRSKRGTKYRISDPCHDKKS